MESSSPTRQAVAGEIRDEHNEESDGSGTAGAPTALPDANQEALREVLYADSSPANLPAGEIRRLFDVPTAKNCGRCNGSWRNGRHPSGRAPKAMVLADNSSPYNPHVFVARQPEQSGPPKCRGSFWRSSPCGPEAVQKGQRPAGTGPGDCQPRHHSPPASS